MAVHVATKYDPAVYVEGNLRHVQSVAVDGANNITGTGEAFTIVERPGTALTVQSRGLKLSGTTLTTVPLPDVTVSAAGYIDQTIDDDLVVAVEYLGLADDGITPEWNGPFPTKEATTSQLTGIADAVAQVQAAAAAAQAAQTAAENVPAGKSAYQVALDAGFTGTQEQWLDSLEGAPGAQGPPSPFLREWELMASLSTGDELTIPAALYPFGVDLRRLEFHTDVAAGGAFNFEKNTGTGWTDLVDNLTIAGGQTSVDADYSAGIRNIQAGAKVRPKVVTAPTMGSGTTPADPVVVASGSYSSGTAAAASHLLPTLSGGQSQDKVVVFVAEPSNNTLVKMSAAFGAPVIATGSVATGTAQLTGKIFVADWSAGLDMAAVCRDLADATNVSRPLAAVVLLIRNLPDGSYQNGLASAGNGTGETYASPAMTLTVRSLVMEVLFYRQADLQSTVASSGGPSSSPVQATVSNRFGAAGSPDVGVVVRTANTLAAGTALGAVTWNVTKTAGTGLPSTITTIAGHVGMKAAAASGTGASRVWAHAHFMPRTS